MASSEIRGRADARLDQAAAAATLADPRPPLRGRLRDLKDSHPDGFEQARTHYEQEVLAALAESAEPLRVWVDYARFLSELTGPGRLVGVDATGLAFPYETPGSGLLILFLPEDRASPVLVALAPAEPSPAQGATVDLLVNRKLSL